MKGLETNGLSKQASDDPNRQEANINEGEIYLMDYLFILWKHRLFIFLATVLPTAFIGVVLLKSPTIYQTTYLYDTRTSEGNHYQNLTKTDYKVMLNKFFSSENTDKITQKLQTNNAAKTSHFGNPASGVRFEVFPPYPDIPTKRITNSTQLEYIDQRQGELLILNITADSKENLQQKASVIRDNLENVLPIYFIRQKLIRTANDCRTQMAIIDKAKFDQEIILKKNQAIIVKLRNIQGDISEKSKNGISLQFDVAEKTEYLPLEYQINAAETAVITLAEEMKASAERYAYYDRLVDLNETLISELDKDVSKYYTLQQFHAFVAQLAANCKTTECKSYLTAYGREIENRISAGTPVSENPEISLETKGAGRKVVVTCIIALMVSVVISFAMESFKAKTS